jgi:hypothetical protein
VIGLVIEAIRKIESRAAGGPPIARLSERLDVHLGAASHERHEPRHELVLPTCRAAAACMPLDAGVRQVAAHPRSSLGRAGSGAGIGW